ncbi:MAG TPA: glycosyltransferase family 4 protein [Chthoniobacteraceae bacterium]|nr:glycosyltransferase family 4 protein [Chthoniobacteraceae bacterium]
MHGRANILFFRQGSFSYINDRVAGWLREQFPQQELVQVDILQDVIKSSRSVAYRGAAAAVLTYPRRLACGDGDFRDLYYRTPYLHNAIRRMVATKYAELASRSLFTFQTQSLYDASLPGLPHFLYTDHTHLANLKYPGADATRLVSPRWIELETALYHKTRLNLVMSAFIRDSLLVDYGCDPANVVVVGAAPNIPAPAAPPDNSNYSNRTILFLGIDWERKGGPVLIEAFRKVREKLPDARLIIAGASPEVQLPNVEVLGRVPLEQVSQLLLRASVLALPTWREPQGINAIEAQMHGIPVVASDVGALPEAILEGKTGHVIPPGDSAALAAALIHLLSDPDLCRRYGEAARAHANARYSSASVSGRLGNAIRAALN